MSIQTSGKVSEKSTEEAHGQGDSEGEEPGSTEARRSLLDER